ncbi:MAG TPA: sigma-70 family RNA polymerase sigma factor [Phycisphaerales bacterium]|nr:sigma-70 family RNA polymerase sigma factor [Phycisphaerales bacterium]
MKAAKSDDLLANAIAGDDAALEQLLALHGPEVRRRLHGAIGERWQSALSLDDVMQEAYTDAFLNIRRFVAHNEDAFAAWLTTLARRNLIDAIRLLEAQKRGGQHRAVEPAGPDESCVALCERLCTTSSTPSRRAATAETCAALRRAMADLPPSYRTVVQMLDLDAQPVEAVASELGRSVGAVYMLRARAHRCLADLLSSGA